MRTSNLFADLAQRSPDEQVRPLLEGADVRIERIVSHGHASPEGFWYDQGEHEWVMVLKGSASVRVEGEARPIKMEAGDFIDIPAHKKHRIEWTAPDEPTVWLAVHYRDRATRNAK